ncbi:hypothetical protein TNCV_2023391 [Trichonephila clavipes]|nr:hypothetical protein TNCV_2023391 [Trichonephila clavipes]
MDMVNDWIIPKTLNKDEVLNLKEFRRRAVTQQSLDVPELQAKTRQKNNNFRMRQIVPLNGWPLTTSGLKPATQQRRPGVWGTEH